MDHFFDFYWDNGYMQWLDDMPGQLANGMWFDLANIHIFIAWIIGYIVGYMLYTQAFKVGKEQGVVPYPMWLHCYMMSIDLIGTITFWYLAFTHDFYWFFCLQGIALPIWLWMEIKSIRAGLDNPDERNNEFGRLRPGGKISREDARFYCIGIFVCSFFLNMWAFSFAGGMENAVVWMIYPFTNYVYAIWCWRFWDTRAAENGNSKYNSVGLQWVITICCITSWVPGLSWWWNVSPFFHNPWFILVGIACTAVSVYNMMRVRKLPVYKMSEDPELQAARAK